MLEKLESKKLVELILSQTPERYTDLKYRKDELTGEHLYLLSFDTNDLITLNKTGMQIFEMCNGKTTIKEMVEKLCHDNDPLSFDEMLERTIFCVRDMQKKGLLYKGNPNILKELEV